LRLNVTRRGANIVTGSIYLSADGKPNDRRCKGRRLAY
jgi:hypothetical protein